MKKDAVNIFWFRRDLRLDDNAGLYHALRSNLPVVCIFIFDTDILNQLEDKTDRRVVFIQGALQQLNEQLIAAVSSLFTFHGKPIDIWKKLITDFNVENVFTNHDYEPYAIQRDEAVNNFLKENGISFFTFKDQVVFEKDEVVKDDGLPYTVFTPYMKKYRSKLNDFYLKAYPTEKYFSNFYKTKPQQQISITQLGFNEMQCAFPDKKITDALISNYNDARNFPAVEGTSRLSVHLRFGTVSIRKLMQHALPLSEQWVNELIWREFYMMILWHFPYVAKSAFKKQYDAIRWRNNEMEFERWCNGTTGYPIVDAGMRQLNETGFMHNRVRMITASFLTKHLLIDWRWGAAYFAQKLLDYDLAANNGGWQWAAGCGTDAAPYFRIFNPAEQTKRFDADGKYIRTWVKDLNDLTYPAPIVDHKFARERCLKIYGDTLKQKG